MNRLGPYLLGPNDENQGIYTGDALLLLAEIPTGSIDAIITDPPYGTHTNQRLQWMAGEFSNVMPLALPEFYRVGNENAALYFFTSWKWMADWILRASQYFRMQNFLIWDKGKHSGTYGRYSWQYHWEGIFFGIKGPRAINEYQPDILRSGERLTQPMQKPVDVMAACIKASTAFDELVIDPFVGFGATAIAAKATGRRWLAFEIDPEVAEMARERVRTTQPPLFVPEPEQLELMDGGG